MTMASASFINSSTRQSGEEWQLRQELAAAYRVVAHYGWDDQLGTHISVRLPGPEHHFLINPFGMLFEEVTASSLVKIDLDGNPVEETGHRVNPAGFIIHSAIHRARVDAICAIHLHTVAGCAVAAQLEGLLPISIYAVLLQGRVGYHDFEGVAVDPGEQPRIVADLGDNDALILRNHGTLTVGPTIADAFNWMYFLERACQMQIAAQSGKRPLIHQPESMSLRARSQAERSFDSPAQLAWVALMRKMDRIDSSYRE
jgi:ribulose-5-phosphate 4-epimerase/fuculose-1-phosphate aldolase